MSDDLYDLDRAIDDLERARELAGPHLPPFCRITAAEEVSVITFEKGRRSSRPVIRAHFTFPGATGDAIWREDLPEMATVLADDYETYQRLKEQWRRGTGDDDGT